MKFSKYISKAVTPVMALFQKQHSCLSNKATTICGYSVCSLRQVPVRHNRGGKSTENKVRLAPPTMCRLTISLRQKIFSAQNFTHTVIKLSQFYKIFLFCISDNHRNLSLQLPIYLGVPSSLKFFLKAFSVG